MPSRRLFENIRATTWRALALAIIAAAGASLILNLAANEPAVTELLDRLAQATGGLVQGPLVAAPLYLSIVGTVIFGVGRLRPPDVGWRRSALGTGILVTLCFWISMQAGLTVWIVWSGEVLRLSDGWSTSRGWGAGRILGQLLAQLAGNALLEEMVYRGYFLPQLYLKASTLFRPRAALVLALLGSQILFATAHIPARLFDDIHSAEALLRDQLELFLQGLLFGALYLSTRNIFICVGLHSLFNQPARIPEASFSPGVRAVWYAFALILLVVWSIARKLNGREYARRSLAACRQERQSESDANP